MRAEFEKRIASPWSSFSRLKTSQKADRLLYVVHLDRDVITAVNLHAHQEEYCSTRTRSASLRIAGLFFEEGLAGFRAPPASLRAEAAMLHLLAVAFAHRTADFAGLDAGPELCAREFEVGAREARDNAGGGETNIGAIVAVSNALDHLRHVFLAQAGVGAGVASFRAGVARGNAFDHGGVIR